MKTLKCDLCEVTAQGETFEAWMQALQPHYMQAHADVMSDPSHTKEDMEKWMIENKMRFEAA
jgi:predicted RNase H-like HicB family nuclease